MEGEHLLQSGNWKEICTRYSSSNLTKESDKLRALSGLAHEYQIRWGDKYLAGLWKKDLRHSLLWKRNEKYIIPEPKRPEKYRAPSWSWASLDAKIEFEIELLDVSKNIVRVDDAFIELSTLDPMGQVSGGRIELRSIIQQIDPYGNIPNRSEVKVHKIYDVPGEVAAGDPVRN
jgi:hypothetical protein